MFLKSLNLLNFRNYSSQNFEFKTPITVLVGNNAQGKSNFLESMYFLATTKSPKAERDEELIKSGETVLKVEGLLEDETKLEIALMKPEPDQESPNFVFIKKVKVNGIPRRVVDYIGNLAVVSFSPEDINLVTGSPSLRRWHIDLTLAQIDRQYKSALTKYTEVVINKNRILKRIKEGLAKTDELDFWTEEQFNNGKIVSDKRRKLFDFLNSLEKKFGEFEFEYLESPISLDRLQSYQGREVAASASLIGPHRDDFKFKLGGRDLSKFGSRGEHRTAVLDLKLSESGFIEKILGKRPILLLDDVFSELDESHRKHVTDLISLQQTVIAAVELDEELKKQLSEADIYKVNSGSIKAI